MNTILESLVTSSSCQITADNLSSEPSSTFILGILLSQELTPEDPFPHLDLLSKASLTCTEPRFSAALLTKFFKGVNALSDFTTVYEETRCVLLFKRTFLSVNSSWTLPGTLGKILRKELEGAVQHMLELVKLQDSVSELRDALKQKCSLLGDSTLSRLTPQCFQFLTEAMSPHSLSIIAQVLEVATQTQSSLLVSHLFVCIHAVFQRMKKNDAEVGNYLKKLKTVMSARQIERLNQAFEDVSIQPPQEEEKQQSIVKSKPVSDAVTELYERIKADLKAGIHVDAEKIGLKWKEMAHTETDKEAVFHKVEAWMQNDELTSVTRMTWKLMIFGMHKILMYKGEKWARLNFLVDKMNEGQAKERKQGKMSRNHTRGENRTTQQGPVQQEEGKHWRRIQPVPKTKPEHPNSVTSEHLPAPPEEAKQPQTTTPLRDFDPTVNPWDLEPAAPVPKPSGGSTQRGKK